MHLNSEQSMYHCWLYSPAIRMQYRCPYLLFQMFLYGNKANYILFPDFVNAYPKNHQRIEVRYVDVVS